MTQTEANTNSGKWLHVLFAASLLVSFFLPWVLWEDSKVSGYAMPAGDFFKSSEEVGGPANPFPEFSFMVYFFWLIPLMAALSAGFIILKKKVVPFSFIAGALSLALVTVFILFTTTLIDLGIGNSVSGMLNPAVYIHTLSAVGLIATAFPVKNVFTKIICLLIGPVFAYGSYKMGENYIMGETHKATENVKADYTVNAADLIKEFIANDTSANKKYLEKVLIVNGKVSSADVLADSTSTIKFADSTGSYAIFSLEKNQWEQVTVT